MKRTAIPLLVSIFLLTACARAVVATATPMPEKTPSITTPVIEEAFTNECKNCHTDKQLLIDTARPVEVIEKESSGAG